MNLLINLLIKLFNGKYGQIKCCSISCCGNTCCSIRCEKNHDIELESIDEEWRRIILDLKDDGDLEMTNFHTEVI